MEITNPLASSFRDPSGFVYKKNGEIYRQVNHSYEAEYEQLMSSGLYNSLVKSNLLVKHEKINRVNLLTEHTHKIIKPEIIPYISYPYEWSFSQLKDAALCTLEIQKIALKHGMILKDASAYNIQFLKGRPIFIDTLSFETYEPGNPWVAYKQFCQHFIAPLALMAYTDIRMSQLLRIYVDGIPLDLTSKLMPIKTWLKYSLLTHLHLHAKTQKFYADSAGKGNKDHKARPISKLGFDALMDSIYSCVKNIDWNLSKTEWGDYYTATNYENEAMLHKETLIGEFLEVLPKTSFLHDLGANDGRFSRIAVKKGHTVISQDIDPVAVEKNYLYEKKQEEKNILPLLQDINNPSGGIGWGAEERESFFSRCKNENVLALALVHHLAISNNVPLNKLSEFFSRLAAYLIIEFASKDDSQVERLLATRVDIFPKYTIEGFEEAFSEHYEIIKKQSIKKSHRVLYLMKRKL